MGISEGEMRVREVGVRVRFWEWIGSRKPSKEEGGGGRRSLRPIPKWTRGPIRTDSFPYVDRTGLS